MGNHEIPEGARAVDYSAYTKPFVLMWRGGAMADKGTEDADATRMWLTGPFENDDLACAWAVGFQTAEGDDPRWQLMHLVTHPGQKNYGVSIFAADDTTSQRAAA